MAKTAAIALSSATCKVGESVGVELTVTNGDAEDCTVVECSPVGRANGAALPGNAPILLGLPPIAPGQDRTVPAGGTLVLRWTATPLAPVRRAAGADSSSLVYDIGATLKLSDGSTPSVSTTTLTASTP